MTKIYSPTSNVAYVIFTTNKKGKKILFSACGNIDNIKDYCDNTGIDYSQCSSNAIDGVHYLE